MLAHKTLFCTVYIQKVLAFFFFEFKVDFSSSLTTDLMLLVTLSTLLPTLIHNPGENLRQIPRLKVSVRKIFEGVMTKNLAAHFMSQNHHNAM